MDLLEFRREISVLKLPRKVTERNGPEKSGE